MELSAAAGSQRWNRWFDRLPRRWLDVGDRRVPAFRSCGIAGFHVAVAVAVLTALRTGIGVATALAVSAVAGLSLFAWGLIRRAVTGRESLVLIEYVWVGGAAVAGFGWASGLALAPVLDVYAVAVAFFLVGGRCGCTVAGCCHGVPWPTGLRYGPEFGLAPRLTNRRLLPVQLIEAAALLVIGVVGLGLAPIRPGAATLWFMVAYAVTRFGCERLRGDRRPSWRGVSLPQMMAVVQLAGAVALESAWGDGFDRASLVAIAAMAVAGVAGLGLVAWRHIDPLTGHDHLDEVWALVSAPADRPDGGPSVASTSLGLTVVVDSPADTTTAGVPAWRHVSLSHPTGDVAAVVRALGLHVVAVRNGVVHVLVTAAAPAPPAGATVALVDNEADDHHAADRADDDRAEPQVTTTATAVMTATAVDRGYFDVPADAVQRRA